MENIYEEHISENKESEAVIQEFIKNIGAEKIDSNSFLFNKEIWLIDRHPFDHSNDIIVEQSEAKRYDKFLLIKTGSDRTLIHGWCDKQLLLSTPARDIYRNGRMCHIVMDTNVSNLLSFKIRKKNLVLKKEFIINQQVAENLGHSEMISGLLAGLHSFSKKANLYFKDINQKDEGVIESKKFKIFTRDAFSDEDMLIPETYYQSHPEIEVYIMCKIKAGQYNYVGWIGKEIVEITRQVQMTGNVDMDNTGEKIRRIFAEQYKNLSDLIEIWEEEKKEEIKIEAQEYFPLHMHSEFSVGDGFGKVDYIATQLKNKGFKGAALTDHGTLAGVWEFQKSCLTKDLKPIIGTEAYVKLNLEDEKRHHVTIFVKNKTGWLNLLNIHARSVLDNFYYKPIVLYQDLLDFSEGLIITSGCSSGIFYELIRDKKFEEADKLIEKTLSVFKDDFYIEIQPHEILENQEVMKQMYEISKTKNIKCIFATDSHYPNKEDIKYHKAVKAINLKKKYSEAGFDDTCFFLMQKQDIEEKLNKEQTKWMLPCYKEFLLNTFEIADKCNFIIEPVKEIDTLPKFKVEDRDVNQDYIIDFEAFMRENKGEDLKQSEILNLSSIDKFFVTIAYDGLKRLNKFDNKTYFDRLRMELVRIIKNQYSNYFLTMWSVANFCNKEKIMRGPGRGSVAACLVALSLNITDIDPIEYNLLWDRFISSIRKDFVDIDSDYEDLRREEVFKYLKDLAGHNHCAKVITYSKFHPKGILRDCGRIFDIPFYEISKVCSMVLERSSGDARSSFSLQDTFAEFKEAREFQNKYPLAAEIAMKLEGNIRHKGVHAAAIILTEKETNAYAPIAKVGGEICFEWEKQLCEDMHLIKYDILGLKTLSVIRDAVESASVELPKNLEDVKVYKNVFKNNMIGIFQWAQVGMQKFTSEMNIERFADLSHCCALFRPSCLHSGQAATFSSRQSGKEPVVYLHPSLEKLTKATKGVLIYQEQIMKIMNEVAGLSWATSEMSRKVMTKSKGKDALNKIRQDFVNGAKIKSKIDKDDAEKLFDIVSTFGCLTGDTKIYRASSNQFKDRETSIKEAFEYQKSCNFKHRGLHILSMSADGYIRPHGIKCIRYTGKRPVYYLRTSGNKFIKASAKHRFLVNDKWLCLKDIKVGDLIRVTDLRLANKMHGDGSGSGNHKTCPRFRLGAGRTNDERKRKKELLNIFKGCQVCSSKKFVELHHINKDHNDNSKHNTMLLCRKHHRQYENCSFARFQKGYYSHYEAVEEIKYSSDRDTYDIEMEEAPYNFIANNFVSHNSYRFNEAHSISYSKISYYCAWLKTYYPKFFYKSLLKYESDASEIKNIMQDMKKNGITIEYPDINISDFSYEIKQDKIYAGLNSVAGIGLKTAQKIIKLRPYISFEDFKKRCKLSEKLLKGLAVADAFKSFGLNKKTLFDKNAKEDFDDIELSQMIYKYTSLTPDIDIKKSYDFGDYDFKTVEELSKLPGQKQYFLRGIVTDVLNKDRLLRAGDNKHTHHFERHLIYLNINDGTGNIACQMNPETYEKFSSLIENIKKQPVVVYGTTTKDGKKIYCDLIQIISKEFKTDAVDKAFAKVEMCARNEAIITSARPAVSKNNKSYYRISLHNGVQGLCFRFKDKLFPGTMVSYSIRAEPFIDLKVLENDK